MKQLIIFLFAFLFSFTSFGQDQCYVPYAVGFSWQYEIDLFPTLFPECEEILGDLHITNANSDISNLQGLSNIRKVHGSVIIQYQDSLPDLSGLEGLDSVGSFIWIRYNDGLQSLSGLEGLSLIENDLVITENSLLNNINGLNNLEILNGELDVSFNSSLDNIQFLNLQHVESNINIGDYFWTGPLSESLNTISGFNRLKTVIGEINIYGASLNEVSGFDSLTYTNELNIYNDSIQLISGFNQLDSTSQIIIEPSGLLPPDELIYTDIQTNFESVRKTVGITLRGTSLQSLDGLFPILSDEDFNMSINIFDNPYLNNCHGIIQPSFLCEIIENQSAFVGLFNNAGGSCNDVDALTLACNNFQNIDSTELIIQHYHQLPNHPSFSTPTFLNSYISNYPELQEFKVCTDGSDASIFEINYVLGNQIEQGEFILRIQEDPNGNNQDVYGSFSSLPPSSSNVITISYNHPQYIESETNGNYIHIELVEIATGDVKETIPLALYNPPVLLVHGLGANGEAFKELQEYLQSEFYYPEELTFSVDYKSTNDEEFFVNEPVIPKHTDGIIKEAIINHYSVGEVDIVAHSMGGILSRIYLQSNYYLNEINKLITVNTPHSGTQLPNYLLDPNSAAIIPQLVCTILFLLDSDASCFDGAVEDLRVNSNAILNDLNGDNLNFNVVPSHVIVTTYSQNDRIVGLMELLLRTTLELLYNGEPHDLIVPLSSQKAGLSSLNISTFESRHDGSYNVSVIKDSLGQLLLKNPNNSVFAQNGFNPPTLTYENQPITPPNTNIVSIDISSSFENQTINYGEEIDIQVTSNSPNDTIVLLFNSNSFVGERDSAEEFNSGSVSINRQIKPSNRLGIIPITAFSINRDENTFGFDTLYVDVTTDEEPISYKGSPTIAFIDKPVSPSIWADFGEGFLSIAAANGIEYDFKNGLAEYIGNGKVKPLQAGVDTFTVTFNGVTSPEYRIRISDGVITNTEEPFRPIKKKEKRGFDIHVSPNPAINQINVSTDVNEVKQYWLMIKSIDGKTLMRKKGFEIQPNTPSSLSLRDLPDGMYIIILYNHLGNASAKFIKSGGG